MTATILAFPTKPKPRAENDLEALIAEMFQFITEDRARKRAARRSQDLIGDIDEAIDTLGGKTR